MIQTTKVTALDIQQKTVDVKIAACTLGFQHIMGYCFGFEVNRGDMSEFTYSMSVKPEDFMMIDSRKLEQRFSREGLISRITQWAEQTGHTSRNNMNFIAGKVIVDRRGITYPNETFGSLKVDPKNDHWAWYLNNLWKRYRKPEYMNILHNITFMLTFLGIRCNACNDTAYFPSAPTEFIDGKLVCGRCLVKVPEKAEDSDSETECLRKIIPKNDIRNLVARKKLNKQFC